MQAQGTSYPFQGFSDAAKRALIRAQEETERAHHSYIDTEHLLLGVLGVEGGLGAEVLDVLGVDERRTRWVVESVLSDPPRTVVEQIFPTSRVKRVIEISFEEARRAGDSIVGTHHLLLGLVAEGDAIAARVLREMGVSADKVRRAIDRLRADGRAERAEDAAWGRPRAELGAAPFGAGARRALEAATQETANRGAGDVTTVDLLLGLLQLEGDEVRELLTEHGIDRETVLRRLGPG